MKPIILGSGKRYQGYSHPVFTGDPPGMISHPETADRFVPLEKAISEKGWPVRRVDGLIDLDFLSAVHAPEMIAYFEEVAVNEDVTVIPDSFGPPGRLFLPCSIAAKAGYFCTDTQTPISRIAWNTARNAAENARCAANMLLDDNLKKTLALPYALIRPPGHHAGFSYFGGYCYLNNAAVAATVLSKKGKVVIFDLDFHHGNGTQEIFYANPDVVFISVHADPATEYPYYWGSSDERGSGSGIDANVNIPVPKQSGDNATARAAASRSDFTEQAILAIEKIKEYEPQFVVVSFGTDACAGDPIGDLGVRPEEYAEIGQALYGLGSPVCIIQEGGYDPMLLAEAAVRFLEGLCGMI